MCIADRWAIFFYQEAHMDLMPSFQHAYQRILLIFLANYKIFFDPVSPKDHLVKCAAVCLIGVCSKNIQDSGIKS